MAQQDAMEQVKEFLRQVIKYRFWISVGVAALFALLAYVLGSRPVRAKAEDETKKIKAAETEVKQYSSTAIPTADYKPIVEEKTGILSKDVNTAWKTLFDRQSPLLTWPETVQARFRKWGRKWPEGEDASTVTLAKVDYIEAFPAYVTMVYKCFKPFDYETGEGIVVAAPEPALLKAPHFEPENLPDLGKIWAAQERLWIQRSVLEVIAQVNKNATDWDSAVIKAIQDFEVGSPIAQDVRSIAKSEQLEEAPAIYAPGEAEAAAAAGSGGGTGATGPGGMGEGGGQRMMFSSMMAGMGRRGSGDFSGGLAGGAAENVFYVKPKEDKGQYKILPILVTVLIDQDHIQDFLIELENSPMSIQVMDFELQRPANRVSKPEKGTTPVGGYGEGGMGMMGQGMMMSQMFQRMSRGGMGAGMAGYGGMMGMMQNQMFSQYRGMGGMGAMGGAGAPEKKGKDVRTKDRAKARKEEEKAAAEARGPSLFDPHFDIVEVTVRGQARFFNPPPETAPTETSPGEAAAAHAPATAETPAAKAPAAGPAEKPAETKKPAAQAAPKAEGAAAAKPAAAASPKPAEVQTPVKPGAASPQPDVKKEASKP